MTDETKNIKEEDEMKALEAENAAVIAEPATTKRRTPQPPKTDSSSRHATPAKTGALWFFSLVNFLILISAIGAGYWFWQQWQTSMTSKDDSEQMLLSMFDDQERSMAQLTTKHDQQIQQLLEQIKNTSLAAEQASQQALANAQGLVEISGRRPSDWLLAEADYLVRMAGRKLWLEHDVTTAVLMLQAADARLQDLADPSLIPIRQFIANDIAALSAVNQVSLTSIALALSSMSEQVTQLPLALPHVELDAPDAENVDGFERILRYFTDNFRYQANDKPLTPLLSAQQQWLAKEQLRYAIMHAQSAAIDAQPSLYVQSLQRAIGLAVQHFDLSAPSVAQFVEALKNLETTNITRSYPERLDSAQPLQENVETRMSSPSVKGTIAL